MVESIREYGFKIPVLARCGGEVVDGHLRLKAARKLGRGPAATPLRFL
jgi:ParB-like chromosome segregation protein Spo0J